jgi:PleD family two-component response regulator
MKLRGVFILENLSPEEVSSQLKLILIVVNDAKVGSFLAQVIKNETMHHIILATDEQQALKIIQEVKPDLFILDCKLSNIESFELYDRLHTTEGLESVPAILSNISTRFPRRSLKKRYIKGRDKSSELENLLHTIEEMLA